MKRLLLILLWMPLLVLGQECVYGDCENGFGRMTYDDEAFGTSYWGKFFKGQPQGLGEYTWGKEDNEDGTWTCYKYKGDWENGKTNGTGITSYIKSGFEEGGYVFEDLIWSYTGEYVNNKRNGIGVIKYPDDTGYVGYWENGKLIKTIAEF
jgi:hypothetical protein